jgi:hypothetical protein
LIFEGEHRPVAKLFYPQNGETYSPARYAQHNDATGDPFQTDYKSSNVSSIDHRLGDGTWQLSLITSFTW